MTLPPVIRIFFAIDLPPAIKEKIGQFISTLKKKSKSHGIRWSKPENLHITLQFLAEIKTEHIPLLLEQVRGRVKDKSTQFTLNLGHLHFFPNPYRPRVIVLDVTPQDQLASLSGWIGEGLVATHYTIEDRPFRGHLTIGRIKQPHGIDLNFLTAQPIDMALSDIPIDEIVLFRSEPQPEGSKYTIMEKIKLTN